MIHTESVFRTFDGLELYRQSWLSDDPRAVICLIHGAFEHSGRFADAGVALADAGFTVHSFDLRGHGKSPGEITPDTSLYLLLKDTVVFSQIVKEEAGGLKVFLLGQSLGGALAIMSAAEGAGQVVSGIVLCAPACKLIFHPLAVLACYALGKFAPGLKIKKLEAHMVSRDPAVADAYENDPLVNRQGIPVRCLAEFMSILKKRQREFERWNVPFLVLHGTQDMITDIRGSRRLICRSLSGDKAIEELPGLSHDLLNDPEKALVFRRIIAWISSRV